jgi:hypothetical protein
MTSLRSGNCASLRQQAPELRLAALSSTESHAQFRIVAEQLDRVLGLFHQRGRGEVTMLGNPSLVGGGCGTLRPCTSSGGL